MATNTTGIEKKVEIDRKSARPPPVLDWASDAGRDPVGTGAGGSVACHAGYGNCHCGG